MATDEEKRIRKQKKKEAKLSAVAAVDAGTWVVSTLHRVACGAAITLVYVILALAR